MQLENTPESDISMDEDWPVLSSATIDCPTSSEPTSIDRVSQEPPNERQNDVNAKVRHELGRGVDHNITGNENARQKPPFLASFHPDSPKDLLATSRSLNNNQRRYRCEEKGRVKFATLPYSLMNEKDKKNSRETSFPHQKRSRTAHLQCPSIARMRVSNDRRLAVSRGSETAEEVIIAPPPAARHHARALMIDSRSIPTSAMRDRLTAVSGSKNAETISVSVARTTLSSDNRPPEESTHRAT